MPLAASINTFYVFYSFRSPFVPDGTFYLIERELVFDAIIYFVIFLTALFLTIKQKYIANCILSGCVIVFIIVKNLFFFNH